MLCIILILSLLLTNVCGDCIVDFEMTCDRISDLKNYNNVKVSNLVIKSNHNVPSETLTVDTLKNYPNLEELTIIGAINNLEVEAFRGLSKLILLKLHKNSIETLTDFTFVVLPDLTKLDLQNNNIRYINTTGPFIYNNLKTVNLSYNKLRYLTWQVFAAPGLERLLLTNNEVFEIGNVGVFSEDLLLLNLDSNQLYTMEAGALLNLQKLTELILSNNQISMLGSSRKLSFQSLRILNLSHNKIFHIQENFFSQMPNLTHLYLNHNKLKQLTNEFSTRKLHTLHLHSNRLQNIYMVVINPAQYLEELTVANNPIPCNCMDNIFLYMDLYRIQTPPCEHDYLRNGSYPTCVGVKSSWSEGQCILSEPVDDYVFDYFDPSKNSC